MFARRAVTLPTHTGLHDMVSMSHEIRTPLNGVLGMATLLGETSLTQMQAEYVQSIQLSGEHLLTVTSSQRYPCAERRL